MMQATHVAILESNELRLHGLQNILSTRRVHISGAFLDVAQCELYLKQRTVDVLFLDDHLPCTVDLWQLLQRWTALMPGLIIVVMSDNLSTYYVRKLFLYKVQGYIHSNDCTQNTVIACLENVLQQHPYISPRASAVLYQRAGTAAEHGLSPMDVDVLYYLEKGLTTHEIATLLEVDVRTVYRSRNALKAVLGVRTNEQILDTARQQGLLDG